MFQQTSMNPSIKLKEFLRGTLPEWNFIASHKESFLSKLLVQGSSHASLISLLKTLGPRQVCQYQFRPNDIVWICKNCQKDETCVLCNECYLDSDHEGHDVFWYLSSAGGCCDCGDPDAWNPNGFCQKHGKKHHDPISFIPAEMKQNAELICNEIIEHFLEFCEEYCDFKSLCADIDDDVAYTIYLYHDDFHTLEEFQRMLFSETLEKVLQSRPENDSEQNLAKTGYLRLRSNMTGDDARGAVAHLLSENFKVRAISYSMRKRYDAILSSLNFLQSMALACDGMCKIICTSLTSARLSKMINYDMFLDRDLGRIFHDLLMSLMADQSFKMVAAVAYSNSFKKICKDYSEGYGTQGHTVFSLSVQFLNREVFVHEICYHENFLEQCTAVLCSLVGGVRKDGNKLLTSHYMTKRRYSPIFGDLKVIGTIPDISRLFLTKNLTEWIDILEFLQRLHPQKRLKDEHIQYEDLTWMSAFNLTLGISSLFDYFCNWFSKADSQHLVTKYSKSCMKEHEVTITHTSVIQVSSYILDRCIQWQKGNCNFEYDRTMALLANNHLVGDMEILNHFTNIHSDSSEEYSFHLPMHSFLAHILMEGFKHPHLIQTMQMIGERLLSSLPSIVVMQQVVLQPIHFSQQVKRNMWRRNGSGVYDQVTNYSEPPFCRVFRDMNLLLLQFSMVGVSAKTSLWCLFSAFDILPCVIFPSQHIASELRTKYPQATNRINHYVEYATVMTTDALQLLINLISELPTEPEEKVSERLIPSIRRELIHVLAAGSVVYSKLQETMAVFYDTDKLTSEQVDLVVSEVANRIVPTNVNTSPLYVLKKEHWQQYDPCFSRLSDQMHSKALELRPKFQESTPIAPPPFACHPYFQTMRSSLLFDDFLLTAMRHLVYIAARNYTSKSIYQKICEHWILSNSDKFFPKVIQLITLSIYEAKQEQKNISSACQSYFSHLCAYVPMDAVPDVDAPSLLESMYDIYIANEVGTLGNDYHSLGWILDQVKKISIPCQKLIEKLERKASAVHSRKADLDAMKTKSQQAAMQSIQAAAAQFLANMDISDDEEEDDEEHDDHVALGQSSTGALGIAERNHDDEAVDLSMERSIGRQPSNELEDDIVFGDVDVLEDDLELHVLDEILSRFPHGTVAGGLGQGRRNVKASKGDGQQIDKEEELSSEKQCIICMTTTNSESCLGLLGLCQPSNLTWPITHRPHDLAENELYCPQLLPKVDHSKFLTMDLETCNIRIGFCGHYMHEHCHLKYFYSSSRKSVYHDNLMLDPSLGFFPCPLCKRLCNCFFPVPANTTPELFRSMHVATPCEEDQEEEEEEEKEEHENEEQKEETSLNECDSLLSSLRQDWNDWLHHYIQEDLESTLRLINHQQIQDYLDQERLIKFLHNAIGPLATGSLMLPLDNNVDDKVKYLEIFISCITYTLCCDLLVGEVPGYFFDSIQSTWSTLQGKIESGISLPFRPYAPGQDDLRRIPDILPLIALFAISCRFDKLTITSILQRIAGQHIASTAMPGSIEREKYWLLNPASPLLTLPLLDVVMFVTSMSMMRYKFLRDEEENEMDIASNDHEDDNGNEEDKAIPFEKLIPWLCIAALVQIMLVEDDSQANRTLSSATPLEINVLQPMVEMINAAWRKSPLAVPQKSFCSLTDGGLRKKMFQWISFLRSVIHILLRMQANRNAEDVQAKDWLFDKVEEDSLTEELIVHHMKYLGLTWLWPSTKDAEQRAEQTDFLEKVIRSWFSALAFDATLIPSADEANEVSIQPFVEIKMADNEEIKRMQVKFYPFYDKYRHYPTLKVPSLFPLPKDYSKLHAFIHARGSYEFPAVCLHCGAVLDAGGQGQCLSHSYLCSKGAGMFFTLQDCRVVLSHGPRCSYFASPYTDKYGEIRYTQRGKPLQLDMNRVDALKKMWLKHSIPTEVFSVRSTAQRVIISGYY